MVCVKFCVPLSYHYFNNLSRKVLISFTLFYYNKFLVDIYCQI